MTYEDSNHLQTFFAIAQMFDLVLFKNLTFGDDFIQLAVVDVIGLHGVVPGFVNAVLKTPSNTMEGYAPVEAPAHRTSATAMQRYKIGDRVVLLPRFAHLFQDNPAVVIEVKIDPFRDMFNEYTIEFPDGSTVHVFEFQVREATN